MKSKKIISFVTVLALSSTMVLNSNTLTVTGKEYNSNQLMSMLKDKLEEKASSESLTLKGNLLNGDSVRENNENYNPDEALRVIVQLDESPAIEGFDGDYDEGCKEEEERIIDSQEDLVSNVEAITGTSVLRNFGYLVNGFSINAKRKDIEKLRALDGVKSVTEVRSFKPSMEFSNQITGAANVWKDLGYKGEGMLVSIIDTGIDYTHKDLQNINTDKIKLTKDESEEKINELDYGKYFTDKVPFGYNYADGNDNVIGEVSQHGMHVAGIVAANGDEKGESSFESIKGVAPEAQLLAMKVFGNNPNEGSAYDDDIIAAIEDSVKLGADVINMSLGGGPGFSADEDPENIAIKNATDAGTICVVSAGNSQTSTTYNGWSQPLNVLGLKDTAEVSSPSTAKGALSVASSENGITQVSKVSYETKEGNKKDIAFLNADGSDLSLLSDFYEVVDCGIGKISDTENDFAGKDLNGKLALIERGDITFQKKYDNAIANGAIGVVMYNSEAGGDYPFGISISGITAPTFGIGRADGLTIKENIEKGDKFYKFSTDGKLVGITNVDANDMSQFTSWGTTPDLEFKPEITAPGGDIYSLQNNNTYGIMSGTSMAAPNTAGSEALILQAVKEKKLNLTGSDLVKFAKNTAMNTAKVLIDKYDETGSVPYSPRRQGAGLIQIEDAIKNNVTITYKDGKAAAALKEVGKTTTFELELKNYGSTAVTYDLSKENVYGEIVNDDYIKEVELSGSSVTLDKEKVTVAPGETAKVTATLNLSNDVEIDNFVEGFISFKSEDSDVPSLSVPFMGFYGDWSKESIVDAPNYTDGNLKTYVGSSGIVSKVGSSYAYAGAIQSEEEMKVDKDKSAFSPNKDGLQDEVLPKLYFLRNAVNVKIQVVNKDGNVVRDLYNSPREVKNSYESYYEDTGKLLTAASWDGTIYDESTGTYKSVDDGQYSIRVTSSLPLEGSKEQILDLPVKVDTKAPEINIEGVKEIKGEENSKSYELTWTSTDNESGSGINDVFVAVVNGEEVEFNNIVNENGKYKAEIPFESGEVNTVQLACIDNAGNMSEDTEKVKATNLKTLAFSNLQQDLVLGSDDIINGSYTVEGTAGDDLSKLIINDKEVTVEDNYFTNAIKLKNGENKIKVYAEDKEGKVILDTVYKVMVDTNAPVVLVNPEDLTEKAPYYTTDKETLDLYLAIEDESSVMALVQGEEVEVKAGHAITSIQLDEGLNTINVSVVDKANNVTSKVYKVIRSAGINKFQVEFDNVASALHLNKKDTTEGVYTVLGHVNKFTKVFKINGQDIKLNDDLSFSYDFKLNDGNNRLKLYAEDEDGNVVINYSYKLYYDETSPTLELSNFVIREDGKIYTNEDLFNVSGKATDNMFGYSLYINGDCLINMDYDTSADATFLEREFSKDVNLNTGLNKINLKVVDVFKNEVNDELEVVLDKEAPNKPKLELSNGGLSNDKVTIKVDTDETQVDKIEYSFDGVNFVPYTNEFTVDDNAVVYARVIDYAGNISEVDSAKVIIDKVAPVVTIDGISNGNTYKEVVKPVIKVDDNEAEVITSLNGEAYNGEAIEKEGEYKLEVYAVDKAGNKSEVITKKFKIEKKSSVIADKKDEVITNEDKEVPKHNENIEVKNSTNNKIIEVEKTGDETSKSGIIVLALVALSSGVVALRVMKRKKEEN